MIISILFVTFITLASVKFAIESETHVKKEAITDLTNKTFPFLLCSAPYFTFYGKEGLLVIAIVTPIILMGSRAARAIICQPPIV